MELFADYPEITFALGVLFCAISTKFATKGGFSESVKAAIGGLIFVIFVVLVVQPQGRVTSSIAAAVASAIVTAFVVEGLWRILRKKPVERR